jgi:hypothetical protein
MKETLKIIFGWFVVLLIIVGLVLMLYPLKSPDLTRVQVHKKEYIPSYIGTKYEHNFVCIDGITYDYGKHVPYKYPEKYVLWVGLEDTIPKKWVGVLVNKKSFNECKIGDWVSID